MTKERRSFVETEASGGSGMRLSTVYDNSPNKLMFQMQSSVSTNNGPFNEPTSKNKRMKRRSENTRDGGKGFHNRKKQTSHV